PAGNAEGAWLVVGASTLAAGIARGLVTRGGQVRRVVPEGAWLEEVSAALDPAPPVPRRGLRQRDGLRRRRDVRTVPAAVRAGAGTPAPGAAVPHHQRCAERP